LRCSQAPKNIGGAANYPCENKVEDCRLTGAALSDMGNRTLYHSTA